MRFRQMRYFAAVASAGSFSRAASILHVAQPAISTQVRTLEAELGVQLLIRHGRGVDLTPVGAILLARIEQILALVDSARTEVSNAADPVDYQVRIGLPTTAVGTAAQPIMHAARERFPRVALQIVEGMTGHLERWLDQDEIDIAILFDTPHNRRLPCRLLGYEQAVLVGQPSSLLPDHGSLGFSQIERLPLIHTTKAHQLRRQIERAAGQCNASVRVATEIDSLPQIKSMVLSGDGFTILPKVSLKHGMPMEGLSHWHLREFDHQINLTLAASQSFLEVPLFSDLFGLVESVLLSLIDVGRWEGARRTIQGTAHV